MITSLNKISFIINLFQQYISRNKIDTLLISRFDWMDSFTLEIYLIKIKYVAQPTVHKDADI